MKFRLLLWGFVGLSLVGCRKSEEVPVAPQSEKRVSFVRGYDEALALAERSIALVDGVQATRAARPRTIASGECVVIEGTRASGGASDTLLYVFNFADDAGFSIIAADASADPLIAVTEKGRYVYGEATGVEPFDAYMAQAISSVTPPGSGPDIPLIPDPRPRYYEIEYDTDVTVGPLLQTKWGQGGIYGSYCPNHIAGCVATAIAQLLAFHEHPSQMILSVDMGTYQRRDTVALDWKTIKTHIVETELFNCSCDWRSHVPISLLMREIGERVNMRYYDFVSGAYYVDTSSALSSFGYRLETPWQSSSSTDVFRALNAGCPGLVNGFLNGGTGGHMWVVDGYVDYKCGVEYYEWTVTEPGITDGDLAFIPEGRYLVISSTVVERQLLHFNWGWDGNCDGYFSFGSYAPSNAYESEYDDPNQSNEFQGSLGRDVEFLLNVHK